jgi:hypothetical protein
MCGSPPITLALRAGNPILSHAELPSVPVISRRTFLAGCALLLGGHRLGSVEPAAHCAMGGRRRSGPHPTPRPGIDASKVLTADKLTDSPDAVPAFEAARKIPQILDGIRCHCGCADLKGFYSLLSCYEDDGMARMCVICQGQARLAERLARGGKSLDEIRAAIDARFG